MKPGSRPALSPALVRYVRRALRLLRVLARHHPTAAEVLISGFATQLERNVNAVHPDAHEALIEFAETVRAQQRMSPEAFATARRRVLSRLGLDE